MEKLIQALSYAAEKHKNTTRKVGKTPYIVHPLGVMKILLYEDVPEEILIAALLHDLHEDENIRFEEIEKKFGKKVSDYVFKMSEPDTIKKGPQTWGKRKKHTIDRVKTFDKNTKLLKCADVLDNARSISDDLACGINVWSKLNATKKQQDWYYKSFLKELGEIRETRVYTLLVKEINTLFG